MVYNEPQQFFNFFYLREKYKNVKCKKNKDQTRNMNRIK